MLKLSKAERATQAELETELDLAQTVLTEAIAEFNEGMRDAFETLIRDKQTEYNEILARVTEFVVNLRDARRYEIDDRSEKWKESEAGEAAEEFVSLWEAWEPTESDLSCPDELDDPDFDCVDAFKELPAEVED